MRIPHSPSEISLPDHLPDPRDFLALFNHAKIIDDKGRYLHWDDFRLNPDDPKFKSKEQHWAFVSLLRYTIAQSTPLIDKQGDHFRFSEHSELKKALHEIDSNARGTIGTSRNASGNQAAQTHYIQSLFEEPYSSSVLEGAATTRDIAKRLMLEKKEPENEHEQMVVNNYRAMAFIKDQLDEQLTPEIVHELHHILTQKTLDDENKAGRFRDESDDIIVGNEFGDEIYHVLPKANELTSRLKRLCDFANKKGDEGAFLHPIIKAITLHFMLAYDHPYVDGNGRTARALFYWSVLKDKYWLLEYISISTIIKEAPIKYRKAFLYTETDGCDLTYFLDHQLDVISKAINALNQYLSRKNNDLTAAKEQLDTLLKDKQLNHRQVEVVIAALKEPARTFTVREHEKNFKITYITATKDFNQLYTLKILIRKKVAQTYHFRLNPTRAAELSKISVA